MLTDTDRRLCTEGQLTTCRADTAIFNAQIKSYVSSIFFQDTEGYGMCKKGLYISYSRPILRQYETTWVYHFPTAHLVTMRCWVNNVWATSTKTLLGNGMIVNSTGCSIFTNTLRTLPELLGSEKVAAVTALLYIPDKIQEITDPELRVIEESGPPHVTSLDDVISQVKPRPKLVDIDTLIHVRQLASHQGRRTDWYMVSTIAVCAVVITGVLSVFLRVYVGSCLRKCFQKNAVPSPNAPDPENPAFSAPNPMPAPRETK